MKAFDEDFPSIKISNSEYSSYPTEILKTGFYETREENVGCYIYGPKNKQDLKVGGYSVFLAEMNYIYPVGSDGLLIREFDKALLYMGTYVIKPMDYSLAFEDLTNKMNILYGQMDYENSEKNLFSSMFTHRVCICVQSEYAGILETVFPGCMIIILLLV